MKILLIRPNHTLNGNKLEDEENKFKYRRIGESLALGYLASSLEQDNHKVDILDGVLENLSNDEIATVIKNNCYDVVGFSTNVYIEAQNNLRIINECDSLSLRFVILGGHVATFIDDFLIKSNLRINCIIRNEGEDTIRKLVKKLEDKDNWKEIEGITYLENNQVIKNINSAEQLDLNNIPFPRRDTIKQIVGREALVNIATSRGCYGSCSFCSVKAFNNHKKVRWHGRSPENVVDELELIVNKYNLKNFLFVDDNYVGPGEGGILRIKKIAELIIQKGLEVKYATNFRANDIIRCKEILPLLEKSGLTYVFVGTESGSDEQLKFFKKATIVEENKGGISLLEENNIGVLQGLILFDYRITIEELKQNIEYAKTTGGVNSGKLSSELLVYHGTQLYFDNKGLVKTSDYLNPLRIDFIDEQVKKVHEIISNTLCWGAELFTILEDSLWECSFKSRNDQYHDVNNFNDYINSEVLNYISKVIETVEHSDSNHKIRDLNNEIITFIVSKLKFVKSSERFIHQY